MQEKIYKKNNKLVIEIPMESKEDERVMANIVGVVDGYECGLCYLIDMSYKGKPDQWSDFFFKFSGGEDEFLKLCKYLGIACHTYLKCFVCEKTLYGTHTVNNDGEPICLECK